MFTKDEFVYMAMSMLGIKLLKEQFEVSEFFNCLKKDDKMAAKLYENDIRDMLVKKNVMKFIQGRYVVDGVLCMIFQQMSKGKLTHSENRKISRYDCKDMDVYVCDDRFNEKKCCVYPCRKNSREDMDDFIDMTGFADVFYESD